MPSNTDPDHADHIALYGNIKMLRSWCKDCVGWAFVINGQLACCGAEHLADPVRYRRMSSPEQRRRLPPLTERKARLQIQDGRCFYCHQHFGAIVHVGGKARKLQVQWDHILPFCYAQDNRLTNFVAACQMCNRWKSAVMFHTLEEAEVYLNGKWEEEKTKRNRFMPELYGVIREE